LILTDGAAAAVPAKPRAVAAAARINSARMMDFPSRKQCLFRESYRRPAAFTT
jgi:hypothetical protein